MSIRIKQFFLKKDTKSKNELVVTNFKTIANSLYNLRVGVDMFSEFLHFLVWPV